MRESLHHGQSASAPLRPQHARRFNTAARHSNPSGTTLVDQIRARRLARANEDDDSGARGLGDGEGRAGACSLMYPSPYAMGACEASEEEAMLCGR